MLVKELEIVLSNDQPYGIKARDKYLLYFQPILHYPKKDEQYQEELRERFDLAAFLLYALRTRDEEDI